MLVSDGVYVYEVQELENGGEARGIVRNHTKLILKAEGEESIIAAYVDWQGNPIPDESRPIAIIVAGTVTQEVTLTPVGGQVTFEAPPGCVIRARADFPCDAAEMRT